MKAEVDLPELMRASGIDLKQVGKNFLACCPWHDDKEASLVVNPDKQLYNCFGCDAKGDVLTFLEESEGLSFREAVGRLHSLASGSSSPAAPKPKSLSVPTPTLNPELLKRVAEHYQSGLVKSEEARAYLKKRGLGDVEMLRTFGVGFCDGSLLKTVPKGSDEGGTKVQ